MITSRSVLLRTADVVEEIKTRILCSITGLKIRAVYETTWKNIAEPGRLQMKIRGMRIACWIPNVTHTHNM